MDVGRKRKFNPDIPAHIDQLALTRGIYWQDGRWFIYTPHPQGGRPVRRTVAYKSARLSDLHAIVEAQLSGHQRGTLRYLFDRFHESMEIKELTLGTQGDY